MPAPVGPLIISMCMLWSVVLLSVWFRLTKTPLPLTSRLPCLTFGLCGWVLISSVILVLPKVMWGLEALITLVSSGKV